MTEIKRRGLDRYIKTVLAILIFTALTVLAGCSGIDDNAAHTSYIDCRDEIEANYGKGDYIYSTVTFTGTGLGEESVLSVKQIEDLAYEKDSKLGYQGEYSFLTSGSIFSKAEMSGVKLYDMLLSLGMDKDLPDDTDISMVSADGYVINLKLSDIKSKKYSLYSEKGAGEAEQTELPVILAFGSDGVPLIGPSGCDEVSKDFKKEDGYNKAAENVGGPVRLVIGQENSDEFNAPNCAKWIRKVVVGSDKGYSQHDKKEARKKAMKVSVYEKTKDDLISAKDYTLAEIEKFAAAKGANKERNYYGEKNFYEGADLWAFLTDSVKIPGREGSVKFTYSDGTDETLDLKYLRNLNGDFSEYITEKDGLKLTGVKPALGYGIDGSPTKDGALYALLPANGTEKEKATIKKCTAVDVYIDSEAKLSDNPYANSRITINGAGIDSSDSFNVGQLETMTDILVKSGDYNGVSLLKLLEQVGLSIDADNVVINSADKSVSISLDDLEKSKKETILATRYKGKPVNKKIGPVTLRGEKTLDNVTGITVTAKTGQWTHSAGVYKKYLDNKITITGPEAKAKKTYTVKDLENLGKSYTVKDSFAAGGGKDGYQGVILKKIIDDNLKAGMNRPSSVTVIGTDGYKIKLSVDDLYKGIESKYQVGESRDMILAYSIDGLPLVPDKKSEGYKDKNGFGPIKLVIENQTSKWVKAVESIKLGK